MAGYTRQSTFADGDTITAALFNNEYNQLLNAFNSLSGHKHDGTTGEGAVIALIGDTGVATPLNKVLIDTSNDHIEFWVDVSSSSVQQLYIADGAIVPVTDNDIDLGTSSLEFKNIYIDGTATIDTLTVDEDATVGTTLGVTGAATLSSTLAVTGATTLSSTLAVTGTSTLTGNVTTTNDLSVGGNLTVTGNATISGNLTFGDADTDSINLSAEIDSHIIPNTNNTYDLGTATKQWRNIFSAGTLHADDINFNGTAITATAAELNILDGVTSTAAELNLLDGVTSTTAELNILDGVTATATEINLLDGVTSTTAELNILDGKAFLDEDNMVSNSATGIASQQSIKAYVDAQVTAQDLDITTDSGTIAIDLDSETLTVSGGTGLDSSATGNAVTLAIDSTVTTLTGTQTLTNKTLTTPVISSISNTGTLTLPTSTDTLVGRATTDTLTNKTLTSATLTSPVINTGVSGTAFLDDDTFATATASTLASSESIKAYVDTTVAATNEVVEDTTPQLGGDLDLNSNDITGTGNINVTGTVTSDGLTVTGTLGNFAVDTQGAIVTLSRPSTSYIRASDASGSLRFDTGGSVGRLLLANNGDISFYEDTGTTQALFWDASAESLGIGTTSPSRTLHIKDSVAGIRLEDSDGTSYGEIIYNEGSNGLLIRSDENNADSGSNIIFEVDGGEKARIDSSGNVGIGTDTPTVKLEIQENTNSTDVKLRLRSFNSSSAGRSTYIAYNPDTRIMGFGEDGNEVNIDSSGNVGIGTTSPDTSLQIGDISATNATGQGRIKLEDASTALSSAGGLEFTTSAFGSGYGWKMNSIDSSGVHLVFGTRQNSTTWSEAMRIDSSGNLLVGKTSADDFASAGVQIEPAGQITTSIGGDAALKLNRGTNDGNIIELNKAGVTVGSIGVINTNNLTIGGSVSNHSGLQFGTAVITPMKAGAESDAAIDIGFSNSRFKDLYLSGTTNVSGRHLTAQGAETTGYQFIGDGDSGMFQQASNQLQFSTAGSEAMRIDSSGNLLVGTTITPSTLLGASATQGVAFNGGQGYLVASASGQSTAYFNRQTSDGTIAEFRKDGSTVGSIGTISGDLNIFASASGHKGLRFGSGFIAPTSNSTTIEDATTDLGISTARFRDLRLSRTGYFGTSVGIGTDSPNELLTLYKSTAAQAATQYGNLNTGDGSGNGFVVGVESLGNGLVWQRENTYIRFGTNATEAMRIDSSGNVGIGTTLFTTNPYVKEAVVKSTVTDGVARYTLTTADNALGAAISLSSFNDANTLSFGLQTSYDEDGTSAPTARMTIDSSGNVGIGTSSVDRELHLKAANPRFRIEDSDGGYSEISANGGHLTLQADAGNTQGGSRIVYEIDADEKMRIDSSGNLFVGTTAGSFGAKITAESTTSYNFESRRTGTGSEGHVAFRNANGAVGTIFTNGSATAYNTSSDARLKDVTGEARGLEVINELNPVSYNWKADGKADEGLIAQEVLDIVPNAVTGSEEEMYQMDYSKLVVHLVKGMKEQQTQIEALQSEINLLKGE